MDAFLSPKDGSLLVLAKKFASTSNSFSQYGYALLEVKKEWIRIVTGSASRSAEIRTKCDAVIKGGKVCIPVRVFENIPPTKEELHIYDNPETNQVEITADDRVYDLHQIDADSFPIQNIGKQKFEEIDVIELSSAITPFAVDSSKLSDDYQVEFGDGHITGGHGFKLARSKIASLSIKPTVKLRHADVIAIDQLLIAAFEKKKSIKIARNAIDDIDGNNTDTNPQLFIQVDGLIQARFFGTSINRDLSSLFDKIKEIEFDSIKVNVGPLEHALSSINAVQATGKFEQHSYLFVDDDNRLIARSHDDSDTRVSIMVAKLGHNIKFDFDCVLKTKTLLNTIKSFRLIDEEEIEMGIRKKDTSELVILRNDELEFSLSPVVPATTARKTS